MVTSHKKWLQHPVNLIDGVLQIDQYFFPNITNSYIQNQISEIVSEISVRLHDNMDTLKKISIINDVLYD